MKRFQYKPGAQACITIPEKDALACASSLHLFCPSYADRRCFLENKAIRAGSNKRSPTNAANIIVESRMPKRTVGRNPQNAYSTMLNPRIMLVCNIAVPQYRKAEQTALSAEVSSLFSLPWLRVFLYQSKKCNVSSTAIPNATLAVVNEATSSE